LHQDTNTTLQTNDTPKIKESFFGGKGTSLESPIPTTLSITSTRNLYVNSVISNPSRPTSSSNSRSSGSVLSVLFISQLGPSWFILVGFPNPSMDNQHAGSLTRYPEFWGKGDEDVEQHWFLCEAIWRDGKNLHANKLVEFHTTMRGQDLKWYMKAIKPGAQGKSFTLSQVKRRFMEECWLPQLEQQSLSDLQEIK
jgi:hypothetical protein